MSPRVTGIVTGLLLIITETLQEPKKNRFLLIETKSNEDMSKHPHFEGDPLAQSVALRKPHPSCINTQRYHLGLGLDGMVIIGHRSSKSIFQINSVLVMSRL